LSTYWVSEEPILLSSASTYWRLSDREGFM